MMAKQNNLWCAPTEGSVALLTTIDGVGGGSGRRRQEHFAPPSMELSFLSAAAIEAQEGFFHRPAPL